MTLEECFVPDEALLLGTEDILPFRRDGAKRSSQRAGRPNGKRDSMGC